jgi:hypothetical protein
MEPPAGLSQLRGGVPRQLVEACGLQHPCCSGRMLARECKMGHRQARGVIAGAALGCLLACSGRSESGANGGMAGTSIGDFGGESEPCFPNGTCDANLTCVEKRCVPQASGGAAGTSSTAAGSGDLAGNGGGIATGGGLGGLGGLGDAGGEGGQITPPVYRPMPNPATANLPHPAAYDTSTKAVVVDKVTGLTWQRDVLFDLAHTYLIDEVDAVCENLELAGYTDWRLPSRQELLTIIDFTVALPALDQTAFPKPPNSLVFWTVTPTAEGQERWDYDFALGESGYLGAGLREIARCVRGERFAASYEVSGNAKVGATVRDRTTGLVWQQQALASLQTSAQASSYCDDLVLASFDDWRVPSIKELQLVIDESKYDPALDVSLFPGGDLAAESQFWSSSPSAYSARPGTWALDVKSGLIAPVARDTPLNVRCVRSLVS